MHIHTCPVSDRSAQKILLDNFALQFLVLNDPLPLS
jgi:hypothetical protein